jgi:hypothetical protein
MPRKKINIAVVRELALRLAGVEETTLHGAPCFKVSGRLLTCPALHKSAEPNSLVVRISPQERARLLVANPSAYYVTDHYRNYASVLVRLDRIDRRSLSDLLNMAWRFVSSKSKA